MTRRCFGRRAALGTLGTGVCLGLPGLLPAVPVKRRVAVMSDIHIGLRSDDRDGEGWLAATLEDLEEHAETIHYGLTLGDITHHGDRASLKRYLSLRAESRIPRWYELAGNHEHRGGGIRHYRDLIGDTAPYCVIDGNVAWFFLSDERARIPGNMTDRSYRWLRENIALHREKIVVLCSHQIPPNTIRRSSEDIFCIHPRKKVTELFSDFPIDLSLCGHEHHRPYSKGSMARLDGTSYINVASVSHAYGTGTSASTILELEDGSDEIVVRRRHHDRAEFLGEFRTNVPLSKRIRLSPAT